VAVALREVIDRSAAPAAVSLALDRLGDAHPESLERLNEDDGLLDAFVAVVGASRSLSRLLFTDPTCLDILADLDHGVEEELGDRTSLARWKSREMLRIAARDLLGRDALEAVAGNLSELAETVLRASCRLADGRGRLAVIGMGKLGGQELNYASDIDVLFVGEGDARQVLDVARTCFRVDANLRPEGRNGPLVRTLASYEAYWDRWASTWEFQSLLKARPVAGDDDLGSDFSTAAAERVWTRPFGLDELREVRAMKARTEEELARRGLIEREVKRGRGGIRDVEFSIQLLQLVHGRQDPALRSPTTLVALKELASAGYVDPVDAEALEEAYRYLRTVEHRLQLVDEQPVHAVPARQDARAALARVMGYRDEAHATALGRFDEELTRHQATVRAIHERLFFRPLLEAFGARPPTDSAGPGMAPEAVEARLAAFGFTDAARTRQALAELTRGLTRSSRLMQQMLPLLLEWLSDSPDPDLGLLGLRTLASGQHRTAQLVATFRESPQAAHRLCRLVGTSRVLITGFERHPDLIPTLGNDEAMAPSSRQEVEERAASALSWRASADEGRHALLRLVRAEMVRIAARDVLGFDTVAGTAKALTDLAEAVLQAVVEKLAPRVSLAVIAMGRFGGAELSYSSDLDVMLVYDGATPEDFSAAEEVAEALLRFISGDTPAERIFVLDADLRPEGKQGPLARSIDGYRAYYERWAQTWERQAALRARPVAGDVEVGARYMSVIDEFLWGPPFTDEQVREIRRMKARVERERIPAGEDPQFHLKLGRGSLSDVEWTAQLLQLLHEVPANGTMDAIDRLVDKGALEGNDAQVLSDAYRFCERARNRWYLVKGSPSDALPAQSDQLAKLARSLDTTAQQLREDYRRVTRRARHVVERVFYGRR
jgi:glutamate-ammonia-ligase adenylyltransferase